MGPLTVLVVSDLQLVATKIQNALFKAGLDCPHSSLVSLETALDAASDLTPELVFVAMSDRPSLDKALSELRPAVTSTIVVVGAPSSPKDVLAAVRAGADDYLNDSEDFSGELDELLHRLRSKRSQSDRGGYTIAISSAVGGSGGSTVAANLAVEIGQRHGRCALLDLRAPLGDQSLLLNLEPRHSLVGLYQQGLELDDATFAQIVAAHECGIELLSAFGAADEERRPPADLLLRIVELAQARCPYVVIDLDLGECDLGISQMSHVICLVTRLDVISLLKTKQAVHHLTKEGIPDEQIVLVANRCGQPSEISIKLAEKSIGRKIDYRLPDDVKNVNASLNVGRPVVLESPSSKVAKGLKQLCDELLSGALHRQRHSQSGHAVCAPAR
jgi:pilus assembly protein CpaE